MPNPRRIERLQQLILETVAVTVQRDLADPRLGFITITRVRLAPDLSLATVSWSCLGTEGQRRTCERALESARRRVQSVVAGRIGTRVTPELRFRFDESLEKAAHLEEIFDKLRHERGEEPPAAGDGPPAEAEGPDAPPPDPVAGPDDPNAKDAEADAEDDSEE